MCIRDRLLSSYDYDGDNAPVIQGSALGGLNGDAKWVAKIEELMEAVDTWIELPTRDVDKPFLMPIEDAVSYTHLDVYKRQLTSPVAILLENSNSLAMEKSNSYLFFK